MAPDPSAKQVAQEATWATFRAAVARMTRRQRDGLRLYLLHQQAKAGDHRATQEAEALAAQIRRTDEVAAHAADLKQQDHGLTEDQARYLAEVALNDRNRETDTHE